LGGAEVEGFGVGAGHEEPTPALCATPPERGFQGNINSRAKFRFYICPHFEGERRVSCGRGSFEIVTDPL